MHVKAQQICWRTSLVNALAGCVPGYLHVHYNQKGSILNPYDTTQRTITAFMAVPTQPLEANVVARFMGSTPHFHS